MEIGFPATPLVGSDGSDLDEPLSCLTAGCSGAADFLPCPPGAASTGRRQGTLWCLAPWPSKSIEYGVVIRPHPDSALAHTVTVPLQYEPPGWPF